MKKQKKTEENDMFVAYNIPRKVSTKKEMFVFIGELHNKVYRNI